jgi:hypothetical protein
VRQTDGTEKEVKKDEEIEPATFFALIVYVLVVVWQK